MNYVLILAVIITLVSILGAFIKKKINESIENAHETFSASKRDKELQKQGTQTLAERYADLNKTQPQGQQPNDTQNRNQQ